MDSGWRCAGCAMAVAVWAAIVSAPPARAADADPGSSASPPASPAVDGVLVTLPGAPAERLDATVRTWFASAWPQGDADPTVPDDLGQRFVGHVEVPFGRATRTPDAPRETLAFEVVVVLANGWLIADVTGLRHTSTDPAGALGPLTAAHAPDRTDRSRWKAWRKASGRAQALAAQTMASLRAAVDPRVRRADDGW
ncbi:MAG: hypothetical protein H6733_13225 [Alphaproteobacteria bacterium]|nr:hypothetical protein [Alphaproteobacteria bacterium]